jgi:hypothetical protein
MEELANLICLGDLISFRGPRQFQLLWGDLKIASQHYIFGFGAGDAQMQKAAKHMRAYANRLEMLVCQSKVCPEQRPQCKVPLTHIRYACPRHAPAVSTPTKQ